MPSSSAIFSAMLFAISFAASVAISAALSIKPSRTSGRGVSIGLSGTRFLMRFCPSMDVLSWRNVSWWRLKLERFDIL